MEELIELVLGNPLLLLLIVGGLISLFRRDGEKKNQESERRQQTGEQSQPKKPSPFGDFLDRMEDALTDGEEEKSPKPSPTPTPSRSRQGRPNRPRPSHSNEPTKQTMSAHETRMEQMQQLSNQIEAGTYEGAGGDLPSGVNDKTHSGITDYSTSEVYVDMHHQTKKLRKQMKERLNKKSLIDSVIMAEVLGEPRSKKPYRGRNMNRHNLY